MYCPHCGNKFENWGANVSNCQKCNKAYTIIKNPDTLIFMHFKTVYENYNE